MMKKKIIHSLGPIIGLLLFGAALWMLRRELKEYSYHDVIRSLEELPALRLYIALALTLFNMTLVLAVMFGALLPSRHHFYRKASLIAQRFTPGWMITIIVVLLCSAWLGIFSYKNITYSDEL
jgi:phosphatidylglycerol lysyltransferase